MTPADRERLTADVKQAEGFREKAYQDSVGVWSIGFGCNLQELVVSEAWAETKLTHDLDRAEDEAWSFTWIAGLSGARQRCIVELIYNLGKPRFVKFVNMIAAIQRGDFETAADHLKDSLWYRQVGPTRGDRLVGMLRNG